MTEKETTHTKRLRYLMALSYGLSESMRVLYESEVNVQGYNVNRGNPNPINRYYPMPNNQNRPSNPIPDQNVSVDPNQTL